MPDTERIPSVVYHYTSIDVLLKIVANEELWATNLRYLSDISERTFVFDEIRKRLPEYFRLNPDVDPLLFRKVNELNIEQANFANLPFTVSFSRLRDSLSQWRSYCPNGNGVSIGFRTRALSRSIVESVHSDIDFMPRVTFKAVHYLKRDRFEVMDKLIGETMESVLADMYPGNGSWGALDDRMAMALDSQACRMKQYSFRNEREYRLVISNLCQGSRDIKYRATSSTLVPYVAIKLPVRKPKWEGLPIKAYIHSVTAGPTPHPGLTTEALNGLFQKQGWLIPVSLSDIPFRDW